MKNFIYSQRIRILRESHNLSITQLSSIMGKSPSAFSQMEIGKIGFSQELLLELAIFFGVTLDWLYGRTDAPYSLSVIKKQEDKIMELEQGISPTEKSNLIYFKGIMSFCRVKEYYKKREKCTLEERSNIIYALNLLKFAVQNYMKNEESLRNYLNIKLQQNDLIHDFEKNSCIAGIIEYIGKHFGNSKRAGSGFAKHCYSCIDILKKVHNQ